MFSNNLMKSTVGSIEGKLMSGWTRARTKEGQLYYLNHNERMCQWDHPEYIKIMNDLISMNSVRYAAYRTALKLRLLQTQTKCHKIPLKCVASAFDNAGLRSLENCRMVSVKEIERIILHIYRSFFKNQNVDVSLYTDIILNTVSNSFDLYRTGLVEVLKCKILLVVMCEGRLQEKYRYLFSQISDNNNYVSRRKLAKLLHSLASISELVCEDLSFGSKLVPAAVESCFKDIYGDTGITEVIFLDWLLQEPQTLVWWSTLYRISSSEEVYHDMKCASCKKKPMVGLRYQCMKCLGYNLCQDCFLHDRTSKKHKLSHPIQEYCNESTGREWKKSFFKIINYKMRKGSTELKPGYLTISSSSTGHTLKSLLQDSDVLEIGESSNAENAKEIADCREKRVDLLDKEVSSRTISESLRDLDDIDEPQRDSHLISKQIFAPFPRKEIHTVILNLECQRKLLNGFDESENFKVATYKAELQTQINKLKSILQTCSSFPPITNKNLVLAKKSIDVMESTPINADRVLHLSLSSIGSGFSNAAQLEVLDNKENHYNEANKETPSSFLRSFTNDSSYLELTFSTHDHNERNTSKNEDDFTYIKELNDEYFSEMNLYNMSIESSRMTSLPNDVPSFEFRTLRDSEIEAAPEMENIDVNNDQIAVIERKIERLFMYLDDEVPRVIDRNRVFSGGPLVGAEEAVDCAENICDLIRLRN